LYGTLGMCCRRLRVISRRAIETRSWSAALADSEWLDPRSSPRTIVTQAAFLRGIEYGEAFYPCVVHEPLRELCHEHVYRGVSPDDHRGCEAVYEAGYCLLRDLLLDGTDSFWFCLALCEHSAPWLPGRNTFEQEKSVVGAKLLAKMLVWWEDLCELHATGRFDIDPSRPWAIWGGQAIKCCIWMGMPEVRWREVQELAAEAAGHRMRNFLSHHHDREH